jgi:hypothetical protein
VAARIYFFSQSKKVRPVSGEKIVLVFNIRDWFGDYDHNLFFTDGLG